MSKGTYNNLLQRITSVEHTSDYSLVSFTGILDLSHQYVPFLKFICDITRHKDDKTITDMSNNEGHSIEYADNKVYEINILLGSQTVEEVEELLDVPDISFNYFTYGIPSIVWCKAVGMITAKL